MRLSEWPEHMTAGECIRLCGQLVSDPTSHTFAATAGWPHPTSYEALALADLFDLLAAVHGADVRYPRPWATATPNRMGHTTLSPDAARAALDRIGARPSV